jgi:signal transduction histidine kinase
MACGTRREPRWLLICGRISIKRLWFYAVLVLAMGAFILLLFRLRLLRAEREFRAVLGERNRIAREIHDTLAQGYVGISVQLEVLSQLLRHNKVEAAAKHLDTTRGFVREGLADARQSIWSLRSQDARETTLPVQMQRMVEHAGGHGLEAKFSLYGAYRPCRRARSAKSCAWPRKPSIM